MKYLFIILTLLCCSCTAHYNIKDSGVEHISWNTGHGKVVKSLEGADPDTFKELLPYYGKDQERVYWQAVVVNGADSDSFVALNNYYGVDAYHGVINGRIIPKSDGSTFEYLGNNWSRDKSNYFYMGEALELCDYESFNIIDSLLSDRAQDKSCLYYGNKRVPVKDFQSLVILPANYAKDSAHVYWGDLILESADPVTFEVKESKYFARDKDQCFSGPQILECERVTEEAKGYCRCE